MLSILFFENINILENDTKGLNIYANVHSACTSAVQYRKYSIFEVMIG